MGFHKNKTMKLEIGKTYLTKHGRFAKIKEEPWEGIFNGKMVNPNVIPSNEGRVNNSGVITISPKTIKQDEIQKHIKKHEKI